MTVCRTHEQSALLCIVNCRASVSRSALLAAGRCHERLSSTKQALVHAMSNVAKIHMTAVTPNPGNIVRNALAFNSWTTLRCVRAPRSLAV